MPNINQMKESRFLKKEDCGNGILVTIRGVDQMNVAKEGAPEEMRWVCHFDETDKPLVLNSTNNQIIAAVAKSDETEAWPGTKVVLYHDPNVSYAGKLTGGIRARAPRLPVAKASAPLPASKLVAPPPAEEGEDVPY